MRSRGNELDRHPALSEPFRRGPAAHEQVDFMSTYSVAGVSDDVIPGIRSRSRNPYARAHRQNRRIRRCNALLGDRTIRCQTPLREGGRNHVHGARTRLRQCNRRAPQVCQNYTNSGSANPIHSVRSQQEAWHATLQRNVSDGAQRATAKPGRRWSLNISHRSLKRILSGHR